MHRPCYPRRAVLQDTNTWSQPAGVSGHYNRHTSMVCCCARAVGRSKIALSSTLLFSLNYSIPLTGTLVRSWPTLGVGELVEGSRAALRDSCLRRSGGRWGRALPSGKGAKAAAPRGSPQRGLPRWRSPKLSRRALLLPRN